MEKEFVEEEFGEQHQKIEAIKSRYYNDLSYLAGEFSKVCAREENKLSKKAGNVFGLIGIGIILFMYGLSEPVAMFFSGGCFLSGITLLIDHLWYKKDEAKKRIGHLKSIIEDINTRKKDVSNFGLMTAEEIRNL